MEFRLGDLGALWNNWEEIYGDLDERRIRVIARTNHRVVGCVDVFYNPSGDEAGLAHIAVVYKDRHKGIGSHFLRAVCRIVAERGAAYIVACHVVVQPFYSSNGWRHRDDYIDMRLKLREPTS